MSHLSPILRPSDPNTPRRRVSGLYARFICEKTRDISHVGLASPEVLTSDSGQSPRPRLGEPTSNREAKRLNNPKSMAGTEPPLRCWSALGRSDLGEEYGGQVTTWKGRSRLPTRMFQECSHSRTTQEGALGTVRQNEAGNGHHGPDTRKTLRTWAEVEVVRDGGLFCESAMKMVRHLCECLTP